MASSPVKSVVTFLRDRDPQSTESGSNEVVPLISETNGYSPPPLATDHPDPSPTPPLPQEAWTAGMHCTSNGVL